MYVVATAGHVDHGKSTLVRALTGMEPDRWAEERRRGMTIDLGYAWTDLSLGAQLAFVDVPGHPHFIGNMLAGLGPAPAVMFVVAADEGWRAQSTQHLEAVNALGLTAGVLAVTRCDLADPQESTREATAHIALSSLGDVEALQVSGLTGQGLPELRAALDRLTQHLPPPDTTSRVRLWIDRSFTIRGAGTVVTGTLGAGTLGVNEELDLRGHPVRIRGLQTLGIKHDKVAACARVGVNLRSVGHENVARGDALLTPGEWSSTRVVDVRLVDGGDRPRSDMMLHIGTAAVAVGVRTLGRHYVRLTMARSMPLEPGDRAILRDPGRNKIVTGIVVLDTHPPAFRLRGAADRRAEELATPPSDQLAAEVRRAGAVRRKDLARREFSLNDLVGVHEVGEWLISPETWTAWTASLLRIVDAHAADSPMDPGVSVEAARHIVGIPEASVLQILAVAAGLDTSAGRLRRPGVVPSLGLAAEAALCEIEDRLRTAPFEAPAALDLTARGLGPRQLAAAEKMGRILRLRGNVVVLPSGPALAVRRLGCLSQPFTTSEARQALGTTRRVVIPLLEYLDVRGWTRPLDENHREVTQRKGGSDENVTSTDE